MSIALMTEVWKLDLSPSDKMVLLALADAANDEGVTWIAVRHRNQDDVRMDLLTKCSLSERAVQGALKRLCEDGYLSRRDVPGRGVIWTVKPVPTPAASAPRSICAPAENDVNPRSKCGETVSNHHTSSEAKASSEDAPAKPKPFDLFWDAYPSKIGKLKADPAFKVACRKIRDDGRDPLPTMLDGLERAKASARWNDPTYTKPNPTTWLNRGGWDDDYGPPALGRSPSVAGQAPAAMSPELQARRRALLEAADA